MTGRVKVSARATATDGRTGLLTNPEHGFEIAGIDLTGPTFLAGIHITNLDTITPVDLDLETLNVTEGSATSVDEGGDWRGTDITATNIRLVAVVPDPANEGFVGVDSEVLKGILQPAGLLLAAMPDGASGADIAASMTFSPSEASLGVRVYIWGVKA